MTLRIVSPTNRLHDGNGSQKKTEVQTDPDPSGSAGYFPIV